MLDCWEFSTRLTFRYWLLNMTFISIKRHFVAFQDVHTRYNESLYRKYAPKMRGERRWGTTRCKNIKWKMKSKWKCLRSYYSYIGWFGRWLWAHLSWFYLISCMPSCDIVYRSMWVCVCARYGHSFHSNHKDIVCTSTKAIAWETVFISFHFALFLLLYTHYHTYTLCMCSANHNSITIIGWIFFSLYMCVSFTFS